MQIKNLDHKKKKNSKKASSYMPTDANSIHILEARAARLSRFKKEEGDESDAISYIRFRLGEQEHYGISYLSAKEVMHNLLLTKLPNTPKFIAGVINWRGMLLTILNLKGLFGLQSGDTSPESSIIVVFTKGITVGILVDNIEGSDYYSPSLLETPLISDHAIKADYIFGLHKGNTAIINIEKILVDVKAQLEN